MSKETTQIVKGIAILLMLFLHLFNKMPDISGYVPLLSFGTTPLAHLLTRAANPVPFFLIVSGYGLSAVYHSRGYATGYLWRRTLRLYVHYWLALTVFLLLILGFSAHCPSLSPLSLLLNYTCLQPSYNLTLWFLFPYVLLSVTSGGLFRLLARVGPWHLLAVAFLLHLPAALLISRYYDSFFSTHALPYQAALYFYLLFPFLIGTVMERYAASGRSLTWHRLEGRNIPVVLLLLLLVALRCLTERNLPNPEYAFAFIWLLLHLRFRPVVVGFFTAMGRYSMMMWFVHKYLFEDLLHNLVYAPRYPLLIYPLAVVLTFLTAYVCQFLADKLVGRLPVFRK